MLTLVSASSAWATPEGNEPSATAAGMNNAAMCFMGPSFWLGRLVTESFRTVTQTGCQGGSLEDDQPADDDEPEPEQGGARRTNRDVRLGQEALDGDRDRDDR